MSAATLIRKARTDAGLTQAQLARRLGVSQAALARLERSGSNPTLRTLEKVIGATGRRLELRLEHPERSIDETLLREALKLSPAERIKSAERLTAQAEAIAAATRGITAAGITARPIARRRPAPRSIATTCCSPRRRTS